MPFQSVSSVGAYNIESIHGSGSTNVPRTCDGDVHWPPRSPDLSICDFFLWGYLKSRVYIKKPRTLDDLKNSIRQEIEAVPNEMLENSVRNFQKRIQICMQQEGRHLKDIIFRT